MIDDLKPCPNPWCKSARPPVLVWDLYRRHVQCDCGVRGPSSDHRSLDGVPHDVINAEAITAWNTRAEAAEAALPAVYRMALEDAEQVVEEHYKEVKPHDPDDRCPADLVSHGYGNACFNIGFTLNITPTPAAEELMARIQTGEKDE